MTKDDTKESLLKVAERLFSKKGYQAVSTRELAEAAGVNLGAIQYHFGSKDKLFIKTVNRMMEGGACTQAGAALAGETKTREEAGVKLASYIQGFLSNLLCPTGPHAFRLVFREVFSDPESNEEMFEAMVSSTVENYIRPVVSDLVKVLAVLKPEAKDQELRRTAASVAGQCSFYATHQPFLERLENKKYSTEKACNEAAQHICSFTLKALGCEEELINRSLAKAFEKK